MVLSNQTVSTFAGSGTAGFSGDGGPPLLVQISSPWGVAVAPNGDVYWTEDANHIVRKLSASTGTVSRVAGTAGALGCAEGDGLTTARFNRPAGLAFNGSDMLYVVSAACHALFRIQLSTGMVTHVAGSMSVAGGSDGVGATAMFSMPSDVAYDPTNDRLYISGE